MKTAILALLLIAVLAGCSHKPVTVAVPPTPPPSAEQQPSATAADQGAAGASEAPTVPSDAKPLWSETGIASWYGAPYHNRRASNGEVYDMHAMTAAHRTLPLGSVVRVTDLKTGSS